MDNGPGRPADRPRARRVDPAVLLDTTRCPACGALLPGQVCARCRVDLSGPDGARLLALSRRAAAALAERDALLDRLAADALRRAAPSAPPVPPPVPYPSRPPVGPVGPVGPPGPGRPVSPPSPSLASRIGVQGLLVALGALVLAVAGVVFLVFAWDRLSLGGRALVIAVITAGAMGGAAWLRPRLAETAESIGGLAVVLVLADAWAIRATGLFGADRLDGAGYATLAAAGCAALLLGWGVAGGVRAGSVAAALVGPLSPVLGGVWLAGDTFWTAARAVSLGLAGAALLAGLRRWVPGHWGAERALLRLVAATGTAAALFGTLVLASRPEAAALVLAAVTVGAVVQASADRGSPGLRRAWSVVAGAAASLTAAAVASAAVRSLGMPDEWQPATVPIAAMAVAWGVLAVAGRARPLRALAHRPASSAARGAACLVTLPSALIAGWQVLSVGACAVARPWAQDARTPLSEVTTAVTGSGGSVTAHLAAVVGLAGAAGLLAASRPHRWAPAVVGAVALAVTSAPLSPALTVPLATALVLVVAVGAAGLAVAGAGRHVLVRPGGLLTAGVAGGVAVVAAWSVRGISVPMTVAGVTGLVLARQVVAPAIRPLLAGGAVVATAVVAGAVAGLAWAPPVADRIVVAAAAGALLAGLLAAVPLPDLLNRPVGRAEQLGGAAAGYGVGLIGAAVAVGAPFTLGEVAPGRLAATLGALLIAATAGAARPPGPSAPAGSRLPVLLAAALAPLAAGAAASSAGALVRRLGRFDEATATTLAAAAAVAAAGIVLAAVGVRRPLDLRRPALDGGAALAAIVTFVTGTSLAWNRPWLWLLWLLLGVAATAAAVPRDRRRLAWVGWALLTASSWSRLRLADVQLLEAYTVPPALVLLAAAGLRLRRDRSAPAYRGLLPGVALAVVPSVLASADGSPWRPGALIALSGLLVVAAGARRSAPGRLTGPGAGLALAVGALTAFGTGAVRSVAAVLRAGEAARPGAGGVGLTGLEWYRVELWAIPAATVVAGAGLLVVSRPLVIAGSPSPTERGRAMVTQVRELAGLPALALATLPSLFAAVTAATTPGWDGTIGLDPVPGPSSAARAGAVLAGAGAVAVARAARPRAWLLSRPLARWALATVLVAAGTGLLSGYGAAEAWTAAAAAVLLAVGVLGMRRLPGLRSWRALGPGLVLLLGPPLMLALAGDVRRVVVVTVGAAVVVVAGIARRWQAPTVLGSLALAGHAVAQLGPWVVRTVAGQPRWVTLAIVGAVLLTLGATYERRLREVRALRMRVSALR